MRTNSRLFVLIAAFVISDTVAIAQSDTTPPTLTALSLSASNLDVSSSPQTLTVNATITDDLSGFSYGYVQFTSPSNQTVGGFQSGYFGRISGTALNGAYRVTVPFPQFVEPGVWKVSVYMNDSAGNSLTLQSATLITGGFPGTMTVVDSTPDTTPPTLLGASFSPSTVDTSAGPQTITVSLHVADSQSGASFANSGSCGVNAGLSRSGTTATEPLLLFGSKFTLASGTAQNGVWQASLTMPQYSGGNWTLSEICLADSVTNRVSLTSTQLTGMGITPVLTDTSVPSDTTPPALTLLSFSPSVIDTSASFQSVTLTLSATDDISGVYFGLFNNNYYYSFATFQSPSGNQFASVQGIYSHPAPIAGTAQSGTWQLPAGWPQFSEQGTWKLTYLNLFDAVGNATFYTPTQLQSMGFPTTIIVTKPSLSSDGAIGSGGGTVTDNSYGTRASVTFPPGLASSSPPTTVSIDVFPNPLSVPTPRGFTMPGTYFENLSFSPTLPEPIPAPGITIVLPLLNLMTPGAHLSLYHIDPVTGSLAPAMNSSGNPVVGTVDAGGLSATFNNVVTFSTVVAYLSNGSVLGDVSGDGSVNCTDVSIVKSGFGTHAGQAGYNAAADLNNDGTINVLDLFLVSRQLPAGLVCH